MANRPIKTSVVPAGSLHPMAAPLVFRMVVLALAYVCFGTAPAFGQPMNLDFYAMPPGNEHVRAVEQYHYGPAIGELRDHRYEAAMGDIAFILRHFPNHPQALMLLIDVCAQWKSPRCDPGESFENAIAVNPNVASTYVLQGIYLSRAKRFPAAIASMEKALTLDPNSINAHYNLGLTYFETKQFDLANEHAQRAYQLGASPPGLRDKLIRAKQWRPIDTPIPDAASSMGAEPKTSPDPH